MSFKHVTGSALKYKNLLVVIKQTAFEEYSQVRIIALRLEDRKIEFVFECWFRSSLVLSLADSCLFFSISDPSA